MFARRGVTLPIVQMHATSVVGNALLHADGAASTVCAGGAVGAVALAVVASLHTHALLTVSVVFVAAMVVLISTLVTFHAPVIIGALGIVLTGLGDPAQPHREVDKRPLLRVLDLHVLGRARGHQELICSFAERPDPVPLQLVARNLGLIHPLTIRILWSAIAKPSWHNGLLWLVSNYFL